MNAFAAGGGVWATGARVPLLAEAAAGLLLYTRFPAAMLAPPNMARRAATPAAPAPPAVGDSAASFCWRAHVDDGAAALDPALVDALLPCVKGDL